MPRIYALDLLRMKSINRFFTIDVLRKLTLGIFENIFAFSDAIAGNIIECAEVKAEQPKVTTILQIPVLMDPSGGQFSVCLDTGSACILTDRTWIKEHATNARWTTITPKRMKGASGQFWVTETVEFDFYVNGTVRGIPVQARFRVIADVMDNLGPRLLLGVPFCLAHGIDIRFRKDRVSIRTARKIEVLARCCTSKPKVV
jgi:hypothetical protein